MAAAAGRARAGCGAVQRRAGTAAAPAAGLLRALGLALLAPLAAASPDGRRMAISSGDISKEVGGRDSGENLDKRQPAISSEPTFYTPVGVLWGYFAALRKWDRNGKPELPAEAFESYSASQMDGSLPGLSDPDLPEALRGLWCGPTHPSDLACFLPYASAREFREDGVGIPSQGGLPGKMFFWDSPGARNTLEFFTRFSVEFQIPKWAHGVKPGLGSGFWTYMRKPFGVIPYPAAVYEGLPEGHHNLVHLRKISGNKFWDPSTASDPALCFCSIFFQGEDVILRNNFGKVAYYVYRVIDGEGNPTKWYKNFTEMWAEGRRLVAISPDEDPQPDFSCSGWCPLAVFGQVLLVFKFVILILLCCCSPMIACCCVLLRRRRLQSLEARQVTPKSMELVQVT